MSDQFFGLFSFVLVIVEYVIYIVAIFTGRNKPQRTTWLLFSLIALIFLAAQLSNGPSLLDLVFTLTNAICILTVYICSLKYGVGGTSRRDKISLVIVAFSLVIWALLRDPLLSLLILIIIDGIGVVLTIIKLYDLPKSEPATTWLLGSVSAGFGIIAIENLNLLNVLYPFYVFVADLAVLLVIIATGRRKSLNDG